MSEQINLPFWRKLDPGLSDRLPAIVVSIALVASVLGPELCWNSVLVCLVYAFGFGSLSGILFSLLIGPSLTWWRAALKGPVFILVSPVLMATIIVWNIPLLLLIFSLLTGSEGIEPLVSLDIIVSNLAAMDFFTVLGLGLLSCSVTRFLFAQRAEMLDSVQVRFRSFVAAFCLLILGGFGYLGGLCWLGTELEPELEELYSQGGASFPYYGDFDLWRARVLADLPESFRSSAEFSAALSSGKSLRYEEPEVWFQTYPVWLEAMREQFKKDPSLSNKQALALANFAEFHFRHRLEDLYEAIPETAPEVIAEVHLLTNMAMLESGRSNPRLPKFLSNIHLSEDSWNRLIDTALQRPGLVLSTPVTRVSVEHYFLYAVDDLKKPATEEEEQPGPLELLNKRRKLNKTWNEFKDGLPYPRVLLRSREDFRNMRSSKASESQLPEYQVSAAWNDLERHELVVAIILMELQRLKVAKQAMPRDWSEFRPEIGALGKAYGDWISVKLGPSEIKIELADIGLSSVRESFSVPLHQDQVPQTHNKLSAADLSYGRKQVEYMLKNRPMMASLVNPDDLVYEWAAARFAGLGSGKRFAWNPLPPGGGYDSASEYAEQAEAGYIQVELMGLQGGRMDAERQWEAAIYAMLEMENGRERSQLNIEVVKGVLNADGYSTKRAKLEYKSAQKLAAFYGEQWLNHMKNRGTTTAGHSWSWPLESFEKWRVRPQLINGHPDFVFRRDYEALLAKPEPPEKPVPRPISRGHEVEKDTEDGSVTSPVHSWPPPQGKHKVPVIKRTGPDGVTEYSNIKYFGYPDK